MRITKNMLENGGEIDFTANYHRGDPWNRGRLSLRKRGEKYELYVHWYRTQKDEVLYSSANLHEVVEYANQQMRNLGYKEWDDRVVDEVSL